MVAFQRGGLDPAGAVRRRDREGVAVRAEVGDLDLAFDDGPSRGGPAFDHRQARASTGWGNARRVDRSDRTDIDAAAHDIARAQARPGAAQRVAVDVGRDLAEVVGDVPLEARQAVLGRKVGRAVDGRDVLEHRGLDLRVGQREWLHLDGDVDRRPPATVKCSPSSL